MNCQECIFFEIGGYGNIGRCHRYPPTIPVGERGSDDNLNFTCTFPWVDSEDWCGEFVEK